MSRHRNVRNMNLDDYYDYEDDDDYYDEDSGDDDYYEEKPKVAPAVKKGNESAPGVAERGGWKSGIGLVPDTQDFMDLDNDGSVIHYDLEHFTYSAQSVPLSIPCPTFPSRRERIEKMKRNSSSSQERKRLKVDTPMSAVESKPSSLNSTRMTTSSMPSTTPLFSNKTIPVPNLGALASSAGPALRSPLSTLSPGGGLAQISSQPLSLSSLSSASKLTSGSSVRSTLSSMASEMKGSQFTLGVKGPLSLGKPIIPTSIQPSLSGLGSAKPITLSSLSAVPQLNKQSQSQPITLQSLSLPRQPTLSSQTHSKAPLSMTPSLKNPLLLSGQTTSANHSSLMTQPSLTATFLCKYTPPIHRNMTLFSSLSDTSKASNTKTAAKQPAKFKFDTPSPDDVVNQARSKSSTSKSGESTSKAASQPQKQKATKFKEPAVAVSTSSEQVNTLAMDLDAFGLSQKDTSVRSSTSMSTRYKRVDIKEEYAKRVKDEKPRLNLVVVGHVDAGKSTMMGHLLVLLGEISDRIVKKYEKEAESMKKGSFAYAWVLDATEDERSRGVTIDVGISKFATAKRQFTLLDAPGHRDFIPNMISGASQADVAVLVVDSNTDAFESGFHAGGQTREHAVLLRSLGVSNVIVAVNKLDMVNWSKTRFDDIQNTLSNFLGLVGFKKSKLVFIPCSGFTGENLVTHKESALSCWYTGNTLVQALDSLESPQRPIDKPFRLSAHDIFKGSLGAGSSGDVTISGRIETGGIQLGDSVLALPINEIGIIRAMQVNDENVSWAVAGDHVTFSVSGLEIQQVPVGTVFCDPQVPVPLAQEFQAQIVTLDLNIPLTPGQPVMVHYLGQSEPGTLVSLLSILDKTTGEVIKKKPRALPKQATALVSIRVQRPIPIERFRDTKSLGRITLRAGTMTVAAGIVTEFMTLFAPKKG